MKIILILLILTYVGIYFYKKFATNKEIAEAEELLEQEIKLSNEKISKANEAIKLLKAQLHINIGNILGDVDYTNKLNKRELWTGMSKDLVFYIFGKPDKEEIIHNPDEYKTIYFFNPIPNARSNARKTHYKKVWIVDDLVTWFEIEDEYSY